MAKKKIYKHHQRVVFADAKTDAQSRELFLGGTLRKAGVKFADGNVADLTPGVDIAAFGSLSQALTDIGSTNITLFVSSVVPVTSNTSVPANISIEIVKGGSFSISTGVTLTINGAFRAGLYQVFSGAGEVVLSNGAVPMAYPQWWGGYPNLATDQTAIIAAACKAIGRTTLYFSKGSWKIVGFDMTPYRVTWRGDSEGETYIELYSNTADMITFAPSGEGVNCTFQDLQFSSFFQYRFASDPGFVPSDVGKVVLGATSGQTGKLVNYNNANKSCYISGGPVYTIGETVSVVSGTGSGVITENMNTLYRGFKLTRAALWKFTNCHFNGFYAGIDFFQDCSTSQLIGCTFGSTNQYGLRFSSSGTFTNIDLNGGFFNENLNRSVYLNSSLVKFTGVKFESAAAGHVLIDSAGTYNQFTGCHFRSGGGPVAPVALDIYGSYNVVQSCFLDQHSGSHDIIIRSGATGNAIILNQTQRSSFVSDSGTGTQYLLYRGNRFSLGIRTDDGACGIQAQGPGRLNRPINTEGKNAGWILADQTGVPKVVLAMAGTSSNDLQLMAAQAMRFYTGSDLVNTGDVGGWRTTGEFQANNQAGTGNRLVQANSAGEQSASISIPSGGGVCTYVARGSVTLVSGAGAVANTAVTSGTIVRYWVFTPGGTQGFLSYANNAGVGFTINSSSATDTSVVQYEIVSY